MASKAKTKSKSKAPQEQSVDLPPLDIATMLVDIVGTSPLICHAWSDKARKMMLDKQQKKAKTAKEAKDPEADYLASMYIMPETGGPGFPCSAFKNAAVDACSHIDGITKVVARGAFHVEGDLVPLKGAPRMREDMVRVGMGTADIRYRAEFPEWSCQIVVRFNTSLLSPEQITHLFNVAGFAIGIGDWRPQKDGNKGMFEVKVAR